MKRFALIDARNALKKTQAQVAVENELSEVYIRKIESGASTPGRNTITKLSEYFGKPVQELFPDIFSADLIQNVSNEQSATSA